MIKSKSEVFIVEQQIIDFKTILVQDENCYAIVTDTEILGPFLLSKNTKGNTTIVFSEKISLAELQSIQNDLHARQEDNTKGGIL
jgi:hypothetical protein